MTIEASVFISWSGERSQDVAEKLRAWLPYIIETPDYWISSHDLPNGKRWASELANRLDISNFGVLVVTPENYLSPWLNFEAGALSKNIKDGRVLPYLVGIEKNSLIGPLGQFQGLAANKTDTQRLVEAIRVALPKPPKKEVIQKRFNKFWPELETSLLSIIQKEPQVSADIVSSQDDKSEISSLRSELAETTALIQQLFSNVVPSSDKAKKLISEPTNEELYLLEGSWLSEQGTHLYMRVIHEQVVAPYCYGGDFKLTAQYYGWKKVGDYWFTRYKWVEDNISGFAFYKLEASHILTGMWWYDRDAPGEISSFEELDGQIRSRGHHEIYTKTASFTPPQWAEKIFENAQRRLLNS